MQRVSETQALQALSAFNLGSAAISAEAYGNGHINDTFLVKPTSRDYILQRINTDISTDPDGLMANITAVTAHLGQRIRARGGDPLRQTLTVVPTRKGEAFHRDENGCWRVYVFVTGSVTHETAETPAVLEESVGRAFGAFVLNLGGTSPPTPCMSPSPTSTTPPPAFSSGRTPSLRTGPGGRRTCSRSIKRC